MGRVLLKVCLPIINAVGKLTHRLRKVIILGDSGFDKYTPNHMKLLDYIASIVSERNKL